MMENEKCRTCQERWLRKISAIQSDLIDLKRFVRLETQQSKEDWNDAFSRIMIIEKMIQNENAL